MKQRFLIALFTALVFGAGFAARVWTDDDRALPPPPALPGGEFVHAPVLPHDAPKTESRRGPDRAKMISDIERMRPEIDAYRNRLDQIEAEFQSDFVVLLKPEQRALYESRKKKGNEDRAKKDAKVADSGPLSDEQIERLRQRPLWNALYCVAITWPFDRIDHDYKLDDVQKAKVRDLLRLRREKFLALVDATPPPSITLSQLATQTQKLVEPAPAAKK